MKRETLITFVLGLVLIVVFMQNSDDFPLTGSAVVDSCEARFHAVGRTCSRGDTPDCTFAREELRVCREQQRAAKLAATKVKIRPDCTYEETGEKRCDVPTSDGVYRVLKELRDSTNSKCLATWAFAQDCAPGEVCKNGACEGKRCSINADCVAFGGKGCYEGKCVSYCEETDAGARQHFIKGTTTSFVGKKKGEEDYCFDHTMLVEWFCDPTYDVNRPGVRYINYEKIRCENGCSEGACRP